MEIISRQLNNIFHNDDKLLFFDEIVKVNLNFLCYITLKMNMTKQDKKIKMMNQDFQNSTVTLHAMPFWCVANPLSDPFGDPVLDKIDSARTAKLLAEAKKEGLIEAIGFHDDDLVPWDPEHPQDDLDPKSRTDTKLREIKEILDDARGLMNSAVCSLHGNRLFRNGGLCNPDPEIRRLAVLETAMRAANSFAGTDAELLES